MKHSFLNRGLALVLLASLATTSQAITQSVIIQGNNGSSGGFNTSGSINIPATCSISCHVEITLTNIPLGQGGGGGCGVVRNGVTVVSASTGGGYSGTYTNTNVVYNQPAGTYNYGGGCGGPANSVDAYIDITFGW